MAHFLSTDLAAILFSGAKPFRQFSRGYQWLKYFIAVALAAFPFAVAEPFERFFQRALQGNLCEINLNLAQWFRRRCCIQKKFIDIGRQTKTGQ